MKTLLILCALCASTLTFAGISKSLDVYQGYAFKADKQTPVGYLTSLKVGGIELAADQKVLAPDRTVINAVAVMSSFDWSAGAGDAMYIQAQLSTASRMMIAAMLLGEITDLSVETTFVVYEYDAVAKKYYKSMTQNQLLTGDLEINGEDANLSVADLESTEVQSPKNYAFYIGIQPDDTAEPVSVCLSSTRCVQRLWGITSP